MHSPLWWPFLPCFFFCCCFNRFRTFQGRLTLFMSKTASVTSLPHESAMSSLLARETNHTCLCPKVMASGWLSPRNVIKGCKAGSRRAPKNDFQEPEIKVYNYSIWLTVRSCESRQLSQRASPPCEDIFYLGLIWGTFKVIWLLKTGEAFIDSRAFHRPSDSSILSDECGHNQISNMSGFLWKLDEEGVVSLCV